MHQKCLIAIGLRLVVGTAAIGFTLAISYYIRKSKKKSGDGEDRSTTSSAGGGASAYETKKAVDEYLQFHFAHGEEILPYPQGPTVSSNALRLLLHQVLNHALSLSQGTNSLLHNLACIKPRLPTANTGGTQFHRPHSCSGGDVL